ncbi:UDP-N-acetylglucosamine transferase subunit ALG13 homolog [Ctenocephalides felis]|uniref:UDP-N-acetylglucosamine transferase subunit ALG13 homolog n=1 Tax=Ctenocephalides felis TaxID=7515 RepID=UPI000E6E2825|nr:UDP-N-acetylglucosamine transferase subunit ALG13 homolog [Ctenocephalides felis]
MSRIFMTVGTTSFDEAISTVLTQDIINIFKKLGYKYLTIQTGNTKLNLAPSITYDDFFVFCYKFKSSIQEDIREADFVISHAGAGSCIEVLNAKKPLLVIVNEKLMGNHQLELANALESRGCLHYCTCSNIKEILGKDFRSLNDAPEINTKEFVKYLDGLMGF